MVKISDRLATMLQDNLQEAVYFLNIGNFFLMNSSSSDYTLSNGDFYGKNTQIVSMDPARLSATVDRELYNVVLSDPEFSFRQYINDGIIGRKVTVRVAFVDNTTGLLVTDLADMITAYGGTVGGVASEIDASPIGSSLIKLQFTSPMGSLDMNKAFYSSSDFMRQKNPDDSSFDQVYLGSGPIIARWGKA